MTNMPVTTMPIMITTMPGIDAMKPGSAGVSVPWVRVEIYDASKQPIPVGGGLLAITHPWPAMLRTIYGDPESVA